MHELGITRNLVEIAEQQARSGGYFRVISVSVEIGALSGVISDAVEFCFDSVTKGTLLEGSKLILHNISAKMSCRDCTHTFVADHYTFACPQCDSYSLDTLQGKELRITEMEVE